ncbi:MAG TPA: Dyp-type peroxidase [Isosphaeraceae bacterium]
MAAATTPTIDWSDVQGMVLKGYGKHPYSANLLLRIDDAARARGWLASASSRVTSAQQAQARGDEPFLNVALSRTGLAKLGFSEDTLITFPTAFLEGMTSPNRRRILGDDEAGPPESLAWGGPGREVDAIALIFARTPAGLDAAVASERTALTGLSLVVDPIATQLWPDGREHFGFHDGISQPVIEGSPPPLHPPAPAPVDAAYVDANVIKAGEFLLGYNNEYDVLPDAVDLPVGSDPGGLLTTVTLPDNSAVPDLGHNGTYLVVRQVAQDVPKLWNYLDAATKDASGQSRPDEREKLGAKLVGRWPSGAPMAVAPDKDDPTRSEESQFLYSAIDPDGFGCPFGAHTRRANPRDTLGDDPTEALKLTKRHRLIRRGRSYGPKAADPLDASDTQERGLMFMAINANIERQFEFVQQTWINSPSFNGLYDERDPIFGQPGGQPSGSMTIPRKPVRRSLHGLGGFVTVRGGAYFFLPSLKALKYLAATPGR